MKCIHDVSRVLFVVSYITCLTQPARAFILDTESPAPWQSTASGRRFGNGVAGTLTWSIVPDGTEVSDGQDGLGGSDLIEFLNDNFDGDPAETDHTLQPWFSIFEESMNRWDELSGLTLVYEPNDDGGTHNNRRGILGRRGDVRISGASIDGPNGVLAFNFLPEFGGDMALDTDDLGFTNSSGNFRFFRNTIMHEFGHGFGLSHVTSDSDQLLMEPFTNTGFDGPQLDEIRAIQFFFGDAFEATNNEAGNGTVELASDLGDLVIGDSIVVGRDADRSTQRVSSLRTDYVSISNADDIDFYSFTVVENSSLTAELTPLGGTFTQAGQFGIPSEFDATSRSALSMSIFDSTGDNVLGEVDLEPGQSDSVASIILEPGTYYTQITGEEDTVQLYMLDLALTALPGDYNFDGIVDSADFTVWREARESSLPSSVDAADGNGDGRVDGDDYQVWVDNFGVDYLAGHMNPAAAVPEPSSLMILGIGIMLIVGHRRRQTR